MFVFSYEKDVIKQTTIREKRTAAPRRNECMTVSKNHCTGRANGLHIGCFSQNTLVYRRNRTIDERFSVNTGQGMRQVVSVCCTATTGLLHYLTPDVSRVISSFEQTTCGRLDTNRTATQLSLGKDNIAFTPVSATCHIMPLRLLDFYGLLSRPKW